MRAGLDKIKEEVKGVSPEELHQVRALVDSLPTESAKPQMTEDEFEQYLVTKGVISVPEVAEMEDNDWQPVEATGQPLSEKIIDDRR
jgi:hypothetical protein